MNKWIGLAVVFSAGTSFAQSRLLIWEQAPQEQELPKPDDVGARREWRVDTDVRGIMANEKARAAINVILPDGRRKTFERIRNELVDGFIVDENYDVLLDPSVPDEKISYHWHGNSGSDQATITVLNGRMSATIQATNAIYTISSRDQKTVLREFGAAPPPEIDTLDEQGGPKLQISSPTPLSSLQSKSAFDTVDVLVVHTTAALAAFGNDQGQFDANVSEALSQLSTAFLNSGNDTVRIRNVLSGPSPSLWVDYDQNSGWPCDPPVTSAQCRWYGHRIWLRTDSTVQSLRNTYGADLVVMIVGENSDFQGLAYTQRPSCGVVTGVENTTGCMVGADYSNFAFAVVNNQQMTSHYVFAHETGHVFGMEHTATSATSSYPWSFAYQVGATQSVMGTIFTSVRLLQFSNPNISFIGSGTPSGTASRFNARTAYCLASAMSGFRSPGQQVRLFWDGFEQRYIPAEGC